MKTQTEVATVLSLSGIRSLHHVHEDRILAYRGPPSIRTGEAPRTRLLGMKNKKAKLGIYCATRFLLLIVTGLVRHPGSGSFAAHDDELDDDDDELLDYDELDELLLDELDDEDDELLLDELA